MMISAIFFLALGLSNRCLWAVRLNPLENNDKLQNINNQYVAEWQWESWPVKQESSEQDDRSPGPRTNVALWMDESGPNWYLFGGRSVNAELKKVYSDVWKYSVNSRIWERVFPSPAEFKGVSAAKMGGMMTLRANLFDEGHTFASEPQNRKVILCGSVTKTNVTKSEIQNIWSNFIRRKKQQQQIQEEKENKKLKTLAVYAPKSSKSNTVWQIDMKDKLWTAYVCCCDTTNGASKKGTGVKQRKQTFALSDRTTVTFENNGTDSENVSLDRTNLSEITKKPDDQSSNPKNKKKKINQNRKLEENVKEIPPKTRRRKRSDTRKENATEVAFTSGEVSNGGAIETSKTTIRPPETTVKQTKDKQHSVKVNEKDKVTLDKEVSDLEKPDVALKPKMTSKYCPEFLEEMEPVTWCDGNNEVLITADISSPKVTLWIFNLKTSHWYQQSVKMSDGIDWPGCSALDSIRYAGNGEEVYFMCSAHSTYGEAADVKASNDSSSSAKNPSKENAAIKIVYQINYKRQVLNYLGEIEMSSYFATAEGRDTWENETKSLIQVVRTPQNETVLLLAYLDFADLWILTETPDGRHRFEAVEKIWRGSALKWFNKYNSPLYNFQFAGESAGSAKTILMPNPRVIGPTEFWPRDRGRFIIRVFKNENLEKRGFENRTREQNLTYQLLQSDPKAVESSGVESQVGHTYSFKVLVFFGISLAMFTAFGVVMFLKRCVTCPPKMSIRNEMNKSPLVIRYSVIPDDLLYPLA